MAVLVKTNVGGGGGVGIEQIIKENGLSDLSIIDKGKGYVSEEKVVDIESLPATFAPSEGVNGFKSLTINKPEDLSAENIVSGVNVLGVNGTGGSGEYVWKRVKRLYLYNEGDECTSVTGGWISSYTMDNYTIVSATKGSTYLETSTDGTSNKKQLLGTNNIIDITPYATINAETIGTGQYADVRGSIVKDITASNRTFGYGFENTSKRVNTLDISSVSGSSYISYSANTVGNGNHKLFKLWLDGEWEYVTDKNENKYPDGDILGEYYYERVSVDVGPIMNLLVPTATTQTLSNGVTFTANGDGTYTLNGTYSSTSGVSVKLCTFTFEANTTYKLSGTPKGTSSFLYTTINGSQQRDRGNGIIFTPTTTTTVEVYIFANPDDETANNTIFKPMLTTNLKATYRDFEKGVEGGITPSMFGCTKMEITKTTYASTTTLSNTTITHSLGSIPDFIMVIASDGSIFAGGYKATNYMVPLAYMYTNSGTRTSVHGSGAIKNLTNTSYAIQSDMTLNSGVTCYFISMV